MLQINNLSIVHTKDLTDIIRDFSFTLAQGDKAVIIGEEGNGKSTLLKAIADESLVTAYSALSGEIVRRNEIIGYLPQELAAQDKRKTLYEFFSELPEFFERTSKELAALARSIGVDTDFFYADQTLETLSGGEKVKAQFLKLLLKNATVLLLDEPSNDIDIETLEWLEGFIKESKAPVLFVSHDETLIERSANVVIHLERIRRKTLPRYTVARMPYRDYIQQRQAKFAHQEQMARSERRDYEVKLEKYRQIEAKVEHQQRAISRQDPHGGQLLKKKMRAVKAMGQRFEREKEDMTKMPEEEDAILLRFSGTANVPRGKTVLDFSLDTLTVAGRTLAENVRLYVSGGEKVCIIGPNGAGKTTLLRLIASELRARADIRAAYMPQNYDELMDGGATPVEFLSSLGDKDEVTRIRTWLGSMKFTAEEMAHPASELSGGQKAKLFFVKMNLGGANVLLLDEPTRNFSPLSNPVIRGVLKDFAGTLISISHDRKYIAEVCDKVYLLTPEGLVRKQ
ncbi:ABC transporter ATP-binding protein uup [bioreactor metagenome]|uniref:ABC transporter ATP-binding protein uup n=1 Tax=bioreactor metagenome TaxID=1076179 RepID=A0A645ANI2_9ZZZZ